MQRILKNLVLAAAFGMNSGCILGIGDARIKLPDLKVEGKIIQLGAPSLTRLILIEPGFYGPGDALLAIASNNYQDPNHGIQRAEPALDSGARFTYSFSPAERTVGSLVAIPDLFSPSEETKNMRQLIVHVDGGANIYRVIVKGNKAALSKTLWKDAHEKGAHAAQLAADYEKDDELFVEYLDATRAFYKSLDWQETKEITITRLHREPNSDSLGLRIIPGLDDMP